MIYLGWDITYNPNRPATGVWRGMRFGVSVSANSLELLKTIINNRIQQYPTTLGA